jgi:predicted phosphodiesterase
MPNGARDPTNRPASSAAIRVPRPRRAYGAPPTKARSRPRCGGAGSRAIIGARPVNVLALYDIHANLEALEAVLADPRAAGPDAIVVGGDAVPGPFARATLDRLDELDAPAHWVRGNGEREVAAAVGAPPPAEDDVVAVYAAITAAELGDEQARALGELPLTLELDGVLYCHASPRRDDELLTRLSPAERWADALAGTHARLLVGGHTHQQDDRVVDGVRFVNAGSVGLPYEGDGAARWVWVADGTPELRSTPYDAAATGERMLAAGWPDERSIRAALIEPIEPIVVTRLFEERA